MILEAEVGKTWQNEKPDVLNVLRKVEKPHDDHHERKDDKLVRGVAI